MEVHVKQSKNLYRLLSALISYRIPEHIVGAAMAPPFPIYPLITGVHKHVTLCGMGNLADAVKFTLFRSPLCNH